MNNMNSTTTSALLNIQDFCKYLNIGKTKGREILSRRDCPFRIKIGNRIYAHKDLLDKYLMDCAKNNICI